MHTVPARGNIVDRQASERHFFDRKAKDQARLDEEIRNIDQARSWLSILGLEEGLRGRDVLECACGTGRFTAVLAEQGANVRAFDISPESARFAERLTRKVGFGNVRMDVAAVEALPYRDASFDVVVGLFILHHLANLKQGIGEVSRVLRPG